MKSVVTKLNTLILLLFGITDAFLPVGSLRRAGNPSVALGLITPTSDAPTPDSMHAFNEKQFHQFKRNQLGKWLGVHAYYDPTDHDVADFMYCQTDMVEMGDGQV